MEEWEHPLVHDDDDIEIIDLHEFFEQLQMLRESQSGHTNSLRTHPVRRCTDIRVSPTYL